MIGQQKLFILWAWMLLVATLCPAVQSKRGGGLMGRIKGIKGKDKHTTPRPSPPTSKQGSSGSSKLGLKLAGAAAAGALGGAAVGYGISSLGKGKHSYGRGHGYDRDSSGEDRRYYYPAGQGSHNQSGYRSAAGPGPVSNILLTLGAGSLVLLCLGAR